MNARNRNGQRRGVKLRFSAAHLLVAVAVLFIVEPLVDELPNGSLIEAVIFTLVMLAGINSLGGTWRVQLAAVMIAIPALFSRWINHFLPGMIPPEFGLVVSLAFVVLVIAHLLRFVVRSPVVTAEVLCSAVAGYLLIAMFWAFAYTLLVHFQPQAFVFSEPLGPTTSMSGFIALYFSVQVLTTNTFGDVMPATNIARMMTLVEATAGVLYLAILIARLVGIYSSEPSADDENLGK
jgi:hypothetical protein